MSRPQLCVSDTSLPQILWKMLAKAMIATRHTHVSSNIFWFLRSFFDNDQGCCHISAAAQQVLPQPQNSLANFCAI
jgi:hypothetical protein